MTTRPSRRTPRCRDALALFAASMLCSCSSRTVREADDASLDASPDGRRRDDASASDAAADDETGAWAAATSGAIAEDATANDSGANGASPDEAMLNGDRGSDAGGEATERDSPDDTAGESGPTNEASSGEASIDAFAPGVLDAAVEEASSDASAESGPDAAPVVPVLTNGEYVFVSGDVSLAVDPQGGARVVSFALAGKNVLTGTDANATNYGSTFWTSPQSDWNWPPPAEIDSLPYVASVDGGTLVLRGSENRALGVQVTKVFSLDPVSDVVSIEYTIENVGTVSRSFAPWEVSRAHPNGVFFFPAGAGAYSDDGGPPLPVRQASGATWFDSDAATLGANIKYFASGSRGWLAQESGGILFVKKFPDVTPDAQAPGESEIELYWSGDHAYVELENQGAYSAIAPGASLHWIVHWYLVKMPSGVDAGVGSGALVAFVDALK